MNKKQSSQHMASKAARTLKDPSSSQIQRKLAGSVLSQYNSKNQSGSSMEDVAAKTLSSTKYNRTTKSLAGSVLSQANKRR